MLNISQSLPRLLLKLLILLRILFWEVLNIFYKLNISIIVLSRSFLLIFKSLLLFEIEKYSLINFFIILKLLILKRSQIIFRLLIYMHLNVSLIYWTIIFRLILIYVPSRFYLLIGVLMLHHLNTLPTLFYIFLSWFILLRYSRSNLTYVVITDIVHMFEH